MQLGGSSFAEENIIVRMISAFSMQISNPKALGTHNKRISGPKTILYRDFGLF